MAASRTRRVAASDHTLVVEERFADARLDQYLTRALPDLSRAQVQKLIHDAHVAIDGRRPPIKPGHRVAAGETVRVTIPAPAPIAPAAEDLPLDILHVDRDLVVINKAAGMVVHPAAGHAAGTLVNALLHHIGAMSDRGGDERPGIVHRLDKGTSGVMVVARTDAAHKALSKQFHDREVTKEYVALVWGQMAPGAVLDKPIGRDPRHRTKMSTRGAYKRPAETTIVSVEPLRGVSLATIRIGTGRTHQIRVHLSDAGHPVVGDDTYSGIKTHPPGHLRPVLALERPFLHAQRLAFAHPRTGKRVSFEAPLPHELQEILDRIR